MWHCMNLVCGPGDVCAAVLLRAGEVVRGADLARKRRTTSRRDTDLAQGPARRATALAVDRALDGADVCDPAGGSLHLLAGAPADPGTVRNGPRTGVGGEGAAHPWRFWIDGDPTVSPYRAHAPRRRR
jgi:DNA-3-methyladenine glycosylase